MKTLHLIIGSLCLFLVSVAGAQQAPAGGRFVGSVQSVEANGLTVRSDSGTEFKVVVGANTRIVRIAPGQRDLRSATPVQLSELQPGDRILVRGTQSGSSDVTASSIIVMKRTDVQEQQARELQDWERRGVGGLVKSVDPAANTIVVSSMSGMGPTLTTIHVTPQTQIRRYAPDSVKFEDARPSTLDQIKPGDQLRARGSRAEGSNEVSAEEIVAGTFRNIAGTVVAANAGSNTVTVLDLATKRPITLAITPESQLHALPPQVAQQLAFRLRRSRVTGQQSTAYGGNGQQREGEGAPGGNTADNNSGGRAGGGQWASRSGGPGGQRRGPADMQAILSHMPAVSLNELHKGDALMIVATQGSGTAPKVITLLSGAEPVLSAAPQGSEAAVLLSGWSLSGGAPAGAEQ
jgi:hypothetical protein